MLNKFNASAVMFAALALSPAARADSALSVFTSDLCLQVARNGDDNGTDSTDAYRYQCNLDLEAMHLKNAKDIVRTICTNAPNYSADLNETADDSATPKQLKALAAKLIRKCFAQAQGLAGKVGLEL